MTPHRPGPRSHAGFTLVEVLVALLVMSLIAGMAWQGIAGMVRTRDASQRRLEATLRLGTVLAQWQQDLASLQESRAVPALRCDGASLRLTRRAAGGLQLVVWSLRNGRWQRWAPPVAAGGLELQELWLRSQQLLGDEPAQVRMLDGVAEWQLYFYRRNAWTNCQSSGDVAQAAVVPAAAPVAPTPAPTPSAPAAAPGAAGGASAPAGSVVATPAREELPSGVRLVLRLAADGGQSGVLTRDTQLAPQPSQP